MRTQGTWRAGVKAAHRPGEFMQRARSVGIDVEAGAQGDGGADTHKVRDATQGDGCSKKRRRARESGVRLAVGARERQGARAGLPGCRRGSSGDVTRARARELVIKIIISTVRWEGGR